MRAVDTNILVRVIIRDDSRQLVAAESFVAEGAWVSVLALAEACWVLSTVYQLTASELVTAIEMWSNHRDFVLDEAETVAAALELIPRQARSGGFSDCLIHWNWRGKPVTFPWALSTAVSARSMACKRL